MELIAQTELDFSPNKLAIAKVGAEYRLFVGGYNKFDGPYWPPDDEARAYLKIYDQYGQQQGSIEDVEYAIECLVVSPDQKTVLVSEGRGLLQVDTTTLHSQLVCEQIRRRVDSISFLPESELALVKVGGDSVWQIDLENERAMPICDASESSGDVVVHPDGEQFILEEGDDFNRILDFYRLEQFDCEPIGQKVFHIHRISSVTFNHRGDMLSLACDHLYLFHYPSLEPAFRIERSGKISEGFSTENLGEPQHWSEVFWSQDDRFLSFSLIFEGELTRVDLTRKTCELFTKTRNPSMRHLAVSSDDGIMATIGIDDTLRVWRLPTRAL